MDSVSDRDSEHLASFLAKMPIAFKAINLISKIEIFVKNFRGQAILKYDYISLSACFRCNHAS